MLGKLAASVIFDKSVALMLARLGQFAIIAIVFIPLERLIPFRPKQRLFRPLIVLDLLHYFVGGVLTIVFVRITYMFLPQFSSWGIHQLKWSVHGLPWWQQVLYWEIGWTFLGYWLHRLEHVWAPLWRMHSIHESSKELDWLSAFRLHPLEPAMFQVLTIVPLWLIGMEYPVAVGYTIYSYVFTHIQHANVRFLPLGPLKYILPTPEFHRWHHARMYDENGEERPAMQNFGQYPIWDVLFGTFYLPDSKPAALGSAYGDQIPTDYLAQLAYPFGLHETVLAWKRAITQRIRIHEPLAKLQTAIAPVHDRLEGQLARLSVVTPTLEGEKS
jgi:sterol desaturase/sphingolipid hydroxylase (fatty acid hydroxylase superfamily)